MSWRARIAAWVYHPALYVQYGMKRSGNHAVGNWLLPKIDARFFNNILPMGRVYAGERGLPDLSDFHEWFFTQRSSQDNALHRQLLKGFSGVPRRAYISLEDVPVELRAFAKHRPTNILVLRSFNNMMSSRIRKAFNVEMPAYPREMTPVMSQVVETWKSHARCYLATGVERDTRVAIFLDAWSVDQAYRDAICRRLDLRPGDEGMESVSDVGGGSSFFGTAYDGQAKLLGVNGRVELLATHERALLERVSDDAELVELCRAVMEAAPLKQL